MKRPCKRLTEMRFLSSTVTYKFSNLTVNIEIMNIINYSSHPPIQKWYLLLWFLQFLVQLIPIRHVYCHFVLQKNELPSVKFKISQMSTRSNTLKTLIHLNHKNRLGDFTVEVTLLTAFLCLFLSKFCVIVASKVRACTVF